MEHTSIDVRELLHWYRDAGVDIALLDEPINHFEVSAQTAKVQKSNTRNRQTSQHNGQAQAKGTQASSSSAPLSTPPPSMHIIPDGNAIALAQEQADQCATLQELHKALAGFEACNLKFTARSTVFSDGNPSAKIMLISEPPRREEDALGTPFVGPQGLLLDKMLAAIGLDRKSVYMTSILPWRPPGNRTPTPAEMAICLPFIKKHIELAAPDVLVLMGTLPAETLLNKKTGIMNLRGKWDGITINERDIMCLPTLHPDYLLKKPDHKAFAWQDLLTLKAHMAQQADSMLNE